MSKLNNFTFACALFCVSPAAHDARLATATLRHKPLVRTVRVSGSWQRGPVSNPSDGDQPSPDSRHDPAAPAKRSQPHTGRNEFSCYNINYIVSERTKSEIYKEFLSLVNSDK